MVGRWVVSTRCIAAARSWIRAVVHLNKFSFITVVTWEAGPRSHFTGQLHVTCYRDIILIGCENASCLRVRITTRHCNAWLSSRIGGVHKFIGGPVGPFSRANYSTVGASAKRVVLTMSRTTRNIDYSTNERVICPRMDASACDRAHLQFIRPTHFTRDDEFSFNRHLNGYQRCRMPDRKYKSYINWSHDIFY